ncbi:sigma-70 family RNA polymerase sigma factor [uncultured Planococcus sp.]|uniref:RNA polymerase sigma factor n=1 Tax=uncultured Planococcus sp. TaxID=337815 RepID=UPI00260E0A02|nr:sigma-70 family RNA polymerase sigma factor [uncultured Planococcus sp.]
MKTTDILISEYQTQGCEIAFNEVYMQYSDKAFAIARSRARYYGVDQAEAESEANIALYKAITAYDLAGGFEPFLIKLVKFYVRDLGRKQLRQATRDSEFSEDAATSTGNEPELAAIKKEQRELLRNLTDSTNDKSRQALAAFASTKTFSFREAGKLLGVEHKTVQNRIRKISAGSQHVSLNEYITA